MLFSFACLLPTSEHLHAVGLDLSRVAILPIFVLPLARLDTPLDINERAVFQVLAANFGQFPKRSNAVPFSLFLLLAAVLILPLLGRGY
jgi:hypothetical protein